MKHGNIHYLPLCHGHKEAQVQIYSLMLIAKYMLVYGLHVLAKCKVCILYLTLPLVLLFFLTFSPILLLT